MWTLVARPGPKVCVLDCSALLPRLGAVQDRRDVRRDRAEAEAEGKPVTGAPLQGDPRGSGRGEWRGRAHTCGGH